MLLPPVGDAVATKFAGVVPGIERDMAFIARLVLNAVLNQFALAGAVEIMVQHIYRYLRMGMAFAVENAYQCRLLGVDADHRVACGQIRGLELGHVVKLRIAVGMRAQRKLLAHLALPQAVLTHELAHRVPARRCPHLTQTAANFTA
jgi:hypothetical protein